MIKEQLEFKGKINISKIVEKLNDLERKKLNYYTPYMKVLKEYDSIIGIELLFNLQMQ